MFDTLLEPHEVPERSLFFDRDTPTMHAFLADNGLDPDSAHDKQIIDLMNAPHTGVVQAEHSPLTHRQQAEQNAQLSSIDAGPYTPLAHALGSRAIPEQQLQIELT